MKFITLTTTEGARERINADAIQRYVPSEAGSAVFYSNAEMEWYRETPAEIDALLVVTADPVPLLIRCRQYIGAHVASEKEAWGISDGGDNLLADIDAAIRAARGE